jgi:hypothetical protein
MRLRSKAEARCDGHSICDRTQNLRPPDGGSQIVSDDCPGIAWKPVKTRGQIDRASTLREVIREWREVIVQQARVSMA